MKILKKIVDYWLDYFRTTASIICFLFPIEDDRFLILNALFPCTYFIFGLLEAMFGNELFWLYGLFYAVGFVIVAWLTRLPEYIPIWRGMTKHTS